MIEILKPSTADPVQRYSPFAPPADPYPLYRELRRERPVGYNVEHQVWLVSRFADVQAVTRDWQTYSHRDGVDFDGTDVKFFGAGDFLETDPPKHTALRAVARDWFRPPAIAALDARIRQICDELAQTLARKGGGELMSEFARPIPLRVGAELLGLPHDELPRIEQLTLDMMYREPTSELPARAVAAANAFRSWVAELGKGGRGLSDSGMISGLSGAVGSGAITETEFVGMCSLMFAALAATTYSLISNTLLALAMHPGQRRYVISNPGVAPAVIEEVLRWQTPLQHSFRTVTTDAVLGGQQITEGSRVLLLFGAANRDEARWEDSEAFDVRREPKRHLAFGEGIHHCLGAPLARLEARVAMQSFLDALPNYSVTDVGGQVTTPTHMTRSSIIVTA